MVLAAKGNRSGSFGTRGNQITVSQLCSSVPFTSSVVRAPRLRALITKRFSPQNPTHLRSIKSNSYKIHVSVFIIPIAPILAANFCSLSVHRSTGGKPFSRAFFPRATSYRRKISLDGKIEASSRPSRRTLHRARQLAWKRQNRRGDCVDQLQVYEVA
ncbi:hypothetical protein CAJAP_02293 [Camponotus japonicus]